MLKASFLILIIVLGCQGRHDEKENILSTYKSISKLHFQSFKNWDVYSRDGMYIFDYKKKDNIVRISVKKNVEKYFIRMVTPDLDSISKVIDEYSFQKIKDQGIDKTGFLRNIRLYMDYCLDKISYREEFDGVIITKKNVSLIYLLSKKLEHKIPKSYVKLNEFWYYYDQK